MPTSLPQDLSLLIETAFAEMNADSDHRLAPQRRRQIYAAIRASLNPGGALVCGWLAVITARRVLPLFQREFPDNPLPPQLLNTAIDILQNKVEGSSADDLQDQGYHAAGNAWGYDETEITWNADLAGYAAYQALKEARGWEPLSNLHQIFQLGAISWPSGIPTKEDLPPRRANQFSDENLCHIENGDTASAAAVAWAGEATGWVECPVQARQIAPTPPLKNGRSGVSG